MIEAAHVSKRYGTLIAVDDLSFEVGRGEIVGFLGPNGAGKTTTLRMLCGFLGPTSGYVRIAQHDIVDEPIRAREKLGYMPESSPLYPELRVREYLGYRAELKGVERKQRTQRVETALHQANIADVSERLIGQLSKGYRQRVGLADALVANPPLLILDEPTSGLDPNQIREVRQLIRGLGQDHTILLSTHILSEVDTTCDRALVIDRGRLVAQGTLAELKSNDQGVIVDLGVVSAEGEINTASLASWFSEQLGQRVANPAGAPTTQFEVTAKNREGSRLDFQIHFPAPKSSGGPRVDYETLAAQLSRLVAERNLDLVQLSRRGSSLEDIFARLTRDRSEDESR